jgi:Spy/CpxP family protein refolding chaperone
MTRLRTLLVILPSMIAGGLLFASQAGHAESGRGGGPGFWPVASDTATGVVVAQADPWAKTRPRATPPAPPAPPSPPSPPTPPRARHNRGMSVSIHDGKVEIDGIQDMVQDQLDAVLHVLDSLPNLQPDVKERVKNRVKAVREKLRAGIGRLKAVDLDKIGPEIERMGDEIEREMEGLDKELEKIGDKLGKHFAEKFGKDFARRIGPQPPIVDHSDSGDDDDDSDSDDSDAMSLPTLEDDPSDVQDKIAALKTLTLNPSQKAKLAQLRAASDQQIKAAREQLDEMSNRLHEKLGDATVSESEVETLIDKISQKEAAIRKARILTWVKARKLFDREQQKQIESALRRGH